MYTNCSYFAHADSQQILHATCFHAAFIVTDTGLAIVISLFYLQEVYGSIELLIFFHTGFTS